ncbi:MAG: hypothetical protein AAGF83_05015 [Cyanobacteria bacterium P01_G01_bin.67]
MGKQAKFKQQRKSQFSPTTIDNSSKNISLRHLKSLPELNSSPSNQQIINWLLDSELRDWIFKMWLGKISRQEISKILKNLCFKVLTDREHDWTAERNNYLTEFSVGINGSNWTLWAGVFDGKSRKISMNDYPQDVFGNLNLETSNIDIQA